MKTRDRTLIRSARGAVRCAGVGMACLSMMLFYPETSGAAPSEKTTISNSGSLDTEFGTRGKVTTAFELDRVESGRAVAAITDTSGELQSLVVAGCISGGSADQDRECSRHSSSGSYGFLLARYTASGALDTTFGDAGKVVTHFKSPSGSDSAAGARDVTVTPSGKVLAVGSAWTCLPQVGGVCGWSFVLIRYDDSGLDESFGLFGKVVTHPTTVGANHISASAVALQPDGKILVAGDANNKDFAIARYSSDGALDPTFGGGTGFVTTDFDGATDEVADIVVQDNHYIVVGGSSAVTTDITTNARFALARYAPSGDLDASFGEPVGELRTGKVTTDFERTHSFFDGIRELAMIGSEIVAVGTGRAFDHKGLGSDFVMARYNGDGALATAVITDLGGTDAARAVVIDDSGRTVVGGFTCDARECADPQFALVRYDPDGSLDRSFGSRGIVKTDFRGDDSVTSLLRQPDGKIVAAGYGGPVPGDFALARYLP